MDSGAGVRLGFTRTCMDQVFLAACRRLKSRLPCLRHFLAVCLMSCFASLRGTWHLHGLRFHVEDRGSGVSSVREGSSIWIVTGRSRVPTRCARRDFSRCGVCSRITVGRRVCVEGAWPEVPTSFEDGNVFLLPSHASNPTGAVYVVCPVPAVQACLAPRGFGVGSWTERARGQTSSRVRHQTTNRRGGRARC